MLENIEGEFTQRSDYESENDQRLFKIATSRLNSERFGVQWNYHSSVYLKRQVLSRLLYQDFLYQQIINTPGVIIEFGVHWGATLSTLLNLRGIYEPFNHSRKIIGFDTFGGFPEVHENDGGYSQTGDYSTSEHYEEELEAVLLIHESMSPIPHMKKFELIKGDVMETLPEFLRNNPQIIVSMAIFDMDIYQPTKFALEAVLPKLTKGSLLVFDELNTPHFPGETLAVQEVLGLNNLRLRRTPLQPYCSYSVYE